MRVNLIKLAELGPGDRPYKGYHIPLDKGYLRVMSSRLDKDGMVVAINYYGKEDEAGRNVELTRVSEKRQKPEDFEADLATFKGLIEGAGMTIIIEDLSKG